MTLPPTPEMVERLEKELAALDKARESADLIAGDLATLRYAKWNELMDARSALRSHQAAHYGAMADEARDQARGRAEDFRTPRDAA